MVWRRRSDAGRAGVQGQRLESTADDLSSYLAFYDERLLDHTRPYEGIPAVARGARRESRARDASPTSRWRRTRRILDCLDLSRHFAFDAVLGGDGPFARKPDQAAERNLVARAGASAGGDRHCRRLRDLLAHRARSRQAGVYGEIRLWFRHRPSSRIVTRGPGHRSAARAVETVVILYVSNWRNFCFDAGLSQYPAPKWHRRC